MTDEILKKTLDLQGILKNEPVFFDYLNAKKAVEENKFTSAQLEIIEKSRLEHNCDSTEFIEANNKLKSSLLYKDYMNKKEDLENLINEIIEVLMK